MSKPLPITYQVLVAWEFSNWNQTPTFEGDYDDITADVKSISWTRGKEREAGNILAATLELRLRNFDGMYTPTNEDSPLFRYMKPYKQIKVIAAHNEIDYPLFYGYISKYQIKPHWETKETYIYCTDGMDLLARQMLTQDYNDRKSMKDGEAITKILDVAGWNTSRRAIDASGGASLEYPTLYEF